MCIRDRALGGDLSVTSEPGNGSVFRIQVEAGELEGIEFLSQPPVSDFVSTESPSTVELPTLNGLRVLVVEDGRTNRRMVRLMLERAGAIMTEAENGKIGVNLATSNEYDIILMDMQMPVMDGYAATRALRLKGLQIPIIAFTAHAMSGDERKCREAGCSDYLSKPVNANQLIHKLGELANTRDAVTSPTTSVTEPAEPIRSCLAYDDPDYREIIEDFIAMLNDRVGEMKLLLASADYPELRKLAHWLKGTAGTAGFDHFTIPAVRLGRAAASEDAKAAETALKSIVALAEQVELQTQV